MKINLKNIDGVSGLVKKYCKKSLRNIIKYIRYNNWEISITDSFFAVWIKQEGENIEYLINNDSILSLGKSNEIEIDTETWFITNEKGLMLKNNLGLIDGVKYPNIDMLKPKNDNWVSFNPKILIDLLKLFEKGVFISFESTRIYLRDENKKVILCSMK